MPAPVDGSTVTMGAFGAGSESTLRTAAAMVGRAFVYGLGAMGEAGVTRALEVMQKELDVTMALTGIRDVKDATPSILRGV